MHSSSPSHLVHLFLHTLILLSGMTMSFEQTWLGSLERTSQSHPNTCFIPTSPLTRPFVAHSKALCIGAQKECVTFISTTNEVVVKMLSQKCHQQTASLSLFSLQIVTDLLLSCLIWSCTPKNCQQKCFFFSSGHWLAINLLNLVMHSSKLPVKLFFPLSHY